MCEDDPFGGVGGIQRISSRQVDDVNEVAFYIDLTVGVFNCGSREIRSLGFEASNGVEQSAFPAIRLADKYNIRISIFSRQLSLP